MPRRPSLRALRGAAALIGAGAAFFGGAAPSSQVRLAAFFAVADFTGAFATFLAGDAFVADAAFVGAADFFATVGFGGAAFFAGAAFVAGAAFFGALDFAGAEAFLAGAFVAGAFLAVAICGEPPSTQVSLRCYRHSARSGQLALATVTESSTVTVPPDCTWAHTPKVAS